MSSEVVVGVEQRCHWTDNKKPGNRAPTLAFFSLDIKHLLTMAPHALSKMGLSTRAMHGDTELGKQLGREVAPNIRCVDRSWRRRLAPSTC